MICGSTGIRAALLGFALDTHPFQEAVRIDERHEVQGVDTKSVRPMRIEWPDGKFSAVPTDLENPLRVRWLKI